MLLGCGVYLLSCLAPFVHPGSYPLLGIIGLGFPLCVLGMVLLLAACAWLFAGSRRMS